jgi:L-threonylcarbamoyladenylate synthase
MIIKKINKSNYSRIINYTVRILKQGGLVIFPSDTVYGALVDATNEKAVRKLIEFKNRPPGKAISVFVSDFEMLKKQLVVSSKQLVVLKQILPGPFTVVLESKHKVCPLLESEKGTLGVRIPRYQLINQLIQKFIKPVTATSANLANRPPHYSVKTLLNDLPKDKQRLIDLIVDAGKLPRNKPSTVIDLTEVEIKILRKGDVDFVNVQTFISKSEEETKMIAHNVISSESFDFAQGRLRESRNLAKRKPLIFIIEGELGVGKTIFVKGIGESLGINNIISPTYVIFYEYGNFYHFDLYQIQDKEEFKYLKLKKFLKPGNILAFEWGEKAGEIYDLLKKKGKIIYVKMKYINDSKREIEIKS